ncbi:MAG: PAS domain S-box protein [Anaerolineae bacterium]|nr:PAS domain S-box protein [Anaerolineae bacterium]
MIMLPDFRVRQRDYLLNISRALTEQLDLSEVLRRILEASASMLAGEIGIIVLDDEHESLRIQAAFGVEADDLNVFNGLLEDLQTRGLDSARLNLRTRQIAKKLDRPLRQVVALPMVMNQEPLGLILVFRTFTSSANSDDRQILQSFADQAAVAVHNARLYAAVTNEKQRLSIILEHSADGIMILDADRTIQRFNRALSHMTGWKPEQAIGRLDTDVLRWIERKPGPTLDEMLKDGWPRGQILYVEGDIERLDGVKTSIGMTYARINDENGHPMNIVANMRDISNFRKADEMKNIFISVISHELKTPVALIKGYAETLRREDAHWDKNAYQEALTVITEEADRLKELIDNLLAATKLQAEGMKLSLSDVRLDKMVEQAVERFRTQSDVHTLELDFPVKFPCVLADETRLRQVVDNLLSNAIKYSPEGGTIHVRGEATPDQVKISVSDEGVGIRPDKLERVFDRFYRVDDDLTRSTQGTGLGLYLARAVVEAHGGRIWAESEPGQGSTFSFTLPVE